MEDEQKLKLLRLSVDKASNFDEAKSYAAFIFGFKEPFAARTPSDDEEEGSKHEYIEPIIEDGVYLVEDGFMPVRFNGAKSVPSPKHCNVMVSYHGHKWIVAKEDIGDDKLPLFSKMHIPNIPSRSTCARLTLLTSSICILVQSIFVKLALHSSWMQICTFLLPDSLQQCSSSAKS